MANQRLELRGAVQREHEIAIAGWAAVKRDGSAVASGTSVYRFDAGGSLAEVVSIAESGQMA